jgi:glycosyltransferase involved in cell wall biosynthesis
VYKPVWIYHDSEEVKDVLSTMSNTKYSDRKYDYMFVMTNSLRKGSEYVEPILDEADRSNADLKFLVIAPYDVIYKIKMKKYKYIKVDTAESRVVPDDKLIQYYANSKTLLFPSKGEGIGYPPIESNELGCSAITTKGLAMNEFREGEIPIEYVGTERYTIIPERYFIYYYPSLEKMISLVVDKYHPNPEYIADKFGMTTKVFADKLFSILNEYVKI